MSMPPTMRNWTILASAVAFLAGALLLYASRFEPELRWYGVAVLACGIALFGIVKFGINRDRTL